jgi:hypothetical protein
MLIVSKKVMDRRQNPSGMTKRICEGIKTGVSGVARPLLRHHFLNWLQGGKTWILSRLHARIAVIPRAWRKV